MNDNQQTAPAGEGIDLCLAPLRGVTGRTFRAVFTRHFGGLSRAVAPFVASVCGPRVKSRQLADLVPGGPDSLPLVPQVIGKDPADLAVMLRAFRDLGYTRADLNAGCPWPMVVRKGRGAGLLADADLLRRMLDAGCAVMPAGFSVKTRLGLRAPDLLPARLEILNAYPLAEVTIHPRTARQMYEGTVDLAAFAACLSLCRHPVVYNGDLRTMRDGVYLRQRFPSVTRWMIGRGLAMDPFLAERLRGDARPRDPARLRAFLDDLYEAYAAESPGGTVLLGRLKELWGYLGQGLADGLAWTKRVHLCHRPDEYRRVVEELFRRGVAWAEVADGLPRE